ncbi:f-box-like domain-containing protein [Ditylenchus destructor]|nr:f-box-like domain-containing protein [Ditylenchus destructor]
MLPDEVLAQIFEKLSWKDRFEIERVCKKWQLVGKYHSWSNVQIFDNKNYITFPEANVMRHEPFLERCGRHLRHVTLREWSPETVLSFIRMAPNVQHLKFWYVKLNDEIFKELAEIVPGLKSLALCPFEEVH